MGALDNARQEKLDRKKAASSTRKVVRNDESNGADWTAADPRLLQRAIEVVGRQGGALRFGYTRDGGAYAVGVYGDGNTPYTQYVRPSEDIDEYLRALIGAWDDGK